ncbi:hypothetical protein [Nocardia sp. NPDC003979]
MFKSLATAAMIALSATFGITIIESTAVVATAQAQTGGLEFRFDTEHECRAFESYQIGQGWHLVRGCHHSPGYNGWAPGWYTILTS